MRRSLSRKNLEGGRGRRGVNAVEKCILGTHVKVLTRGKKSG